MNEKSPEDLAYERDAERQIKNHARIHGPRNGIESLPGYTRRRARLRLIVKMVRDAARGVLKPKED